MSPRLKDQGIYLNLLCFSEYFYSITVPCLIFSSLVNLMESHSSYDNNLIKFCTSIHFVDNQLFPSLIGISPLITIHYKSLLRLRIRSSSFLSKTFNLIIISSHRFRVYKNLLIWAQVSYFWLITAFLFCLPFDL